MWPAIFGIYFAINKTLKVLEKFQELTILAYNFYEYSLAVQARFVLPR